MDDFVKALNGAKGDLDAWLECNNEAECRVAIFAAIEDSVAEERKRIADALRRAGASLPAPENKGTVESAMATGLSIALMIVCDEEKEK